MGSVPCCWLPATSPGTMLWSRMQCAGWRRYLRTDHVSDLTGENAIHCDSWGLGCKMEEINETILSSHCLCSVTSCVTSGSILSISDHYGGRNILTGKKQQQQELLQGELTTEAVACSSTYRGVFLNPFSRTATYLPGGFLAEFISF